MIVRDIAMQEATTRYSRPFFVGRMPLPPSVNASYRPVHNRRTGIAGTDELVTFKEYTFISLRAATVDWGIVQAIQKAKKNKRSEEKYIPLAASLTFYFESMWKRDLDGGIKAAMDAVFAHLQLDDVLIVKFHSIEKHVDKRDPHVEVSVSCVLGGWE